MSRRVSEASARARKGSEASGMSRVVEEGRTLDGVERHTCISITSVYVLCRLHAATALCF